MGRGQARGVRCLLDDIFEVQACLESKMDWLCFFRIPVEWRETMVSFYEELRAEAIDN